MAYADVSVSNAESRQTKIPIALNYDLAFNVGGTQTANQNNPFDAGSDTSTPKAVSAQGGPATLNDASPIAVGGGNAGAPKGMTISWPIMAAIGAVVAAALYFVLRK